MAKSSQQIWMSFKGAQDQANRMDEIAKKLESAAQKNLMGEMNRLAPKWKSDSSNQFRKKGQNVSNNLVATAKNIRNTASTIRTIAKNTYDAEMEALRLAQARNYK